MTRHKVYVITHGYYDSGSTKVMRVHMTKADADRDLAFVSEFGTERWELHESELFGDVTELETVEDQ